MLPTAIFLPSRSENVSTDLDLNGCGAREQIASWLSHWIGKTGSDVHIFTNQEKPAHYFDGASQVHWIEQDMIAPMLTSYEWETLISFDFPNVASIPNIKDTVGRIVLSCNYYSSPPEGRVGENVLELIDEFVYPSEWAATNSGEVNGYDPDKAVVIPYTYDQRFHRPVDKEHDENRFIYVSQPEDGLAQLLRAWPEIYDYCALKPTLTIAVDVQEFVDTIQWSHSIQSELALDIRDLIDLPGVRYIGRQGRAALQQELRDADALLFPAEPLTPSEMGCLSMIQAASCECLPIFKPVDALEELYGEIGYMADDSISFAEHVIDMIKFDFGSMKKDSARKIEELGRDPVSVAQDWLEFLGVKSAYSPAA